jgi:hypothetical protein
MLMNATTEREIMWFEVANGTDDPVYVTFDYAQPGAEYDLTWQRSNAVIYTESAPSGCTTDVNGTCPSPWPTGYESDGAVLINQLMPASAWSLRAWDITTGTAIPITTCNGCDANEYLMAPRLDPTRPHRYRVALIVINLSALAPRHASEPIELYADEALDPSLPTLIITGKRYGTIYKCIQEMVGLGCFVSGLFRHYRAIRSAAIEMSPATIIGRVAPSERLTPRSPTALPGTFGIPPSLSSFTWTVDELALPDVEPPL